MYSCTAGITYISIGEYVVCTLIPNFLSELVSDINRISIILSIGQIFMILHICFYCMQLNGSKIS